MLCYKLEVRHFKIESSRRPICRTPEPRTSTVSAGRLADRGRDRFNVRAMLETDIQQSATYSGVINLIVKRHADLNR